ncbi:MAG TPA: tripartite tricarboxylate transporter substrate binding protein [Burkholderiales bacterium]|nr:tripartite tricarboxylate transporter substrate binding protein [Burkholderiales bacterium]
MRRICAAVFAGAAVLAVLCASAGAQTYPNRPVRMVLTFGAPGGAPDTIARTLGPELSKLWSQQVVIDPRPGGGGMLATDIVSKATPDGYTIILVSPSHVINPALHSKMPFDAVKDFVAITQVAEVPNILTVHPAVQARSVKELVALAKAKPGALAYASSGVGSSQHLAGELFREMAGINIVHVPYKTGAAANLDLIAGRVQVGFASTTSVPHIRAGKLVALGVTSAKRTGALPEVPTVSESGLPKYEAAAWYGVLAPARTPVAIVKQLHADIRKASHAPELVQIQKQLMIEPTFSASPAEFDAFLARERRKWGEIVRKSGAKID